MANEMVFVAAKPKIVFVSFSDNHKVFPGFCGFVPSSIDNLYLTMVSNIQLIINKPN